MIDISPADEAIVNEILKKYVPKCEVRVFGSRHKWTTKPYSDLDIAIVGDAKLDKKTLYALQESFEESELNFRVDVLDWYAISDEFRQIIEQGYTVIQEKEIDNQLPDGWVVKKLGDVIKMTTGRLNANKAEKNGIYPFFTCAPQPYKINIAAFDCDAVLLAGNNANGTFHVNKYNGKFNAYQRTYVITSTEYTEINFIYYKLKNIISDFIGTSQGSATKFLTKPLIENTLINLPPLAEQKKIATILSSLDDKIELNQQINKKLEEVAQSIFKEWFIDFNFPDENGNPYRDSGGAMIDSELGLIPAFWTVGSVSDICDYVASGGTPSTKENSYYEDGIIKWFTTKELNDGFIFDSGKKISETGLSNSSAKIFPKYAVLVAMYGATAGKIAILSNSGTFNQATCGMIADENKSSVWFLYLWLLNMREHLVSLSNGAAQQNLNVSQIKNYPILLIDRIINKKFSNFAENIFLQIERNYQEIIKLQNVRDALLPKLISGSLKI